MDMDNDVNMEEDRSQFSELLRYSKPMLTAAGVITLCIMVVGVIGNCLTIIALIRHSKLRTVAAAFIASLCISDLLFCFTVLPFAASQFFHGTWIHGDVLCTLIPLMRYGSVGVSLISIATISINRYILIAKPHLYPKIYTRLKVSLYIGVTWAFSYGLQVPTIFGVWGVFGLDKNLGTCSINPDQNGHSPKTALFVLGFATPCLIIVICYAKIYWVVRESHQRLQQHSDTSNTVKTKRSEMHITKMVLVIFFCFVICYLPLTIVKVYDPKVRHAPVHVLAYLLLYLAACANPVIYVSMNKQYRHAYLDTVRCAMAPTHESSTPAPPLKHLHHEHSLSVSYLKNNALFGPNNMSPKV